MKVFTSSSIYTLKFYVIKSYTVKNQILHRQKSTEPKPGLL